MNMAAEMSEVELAQEMKRLHARLMEYESGLHNIGKQPSDVKPVETAYGSENGREDG